MQKFERLGDHEPVQDLFVKKNHNGHWMISWDKQDWRFWALSLVTKGELRQQLRSFDPKCWPVFLKEGK